MAHLREVFEKIDADGTGMINATELKSYLQKTHMGMSDKEI